MSQDQVYGLMVGLTLITRFVDEDANFDNLPFQDQRVSFRDESSAIMHRIMNHIIEDDFQMRDPNNNFADGFGQNPYFISAYPLARVAAMINPSQATYYTLQPQAVNNYTFWQSLQSLLTITDICSLIDDQDWIDLTTGVLIPEDRRQELIDACQREYNTRMMLDLAAMCNCWIDPGLNINSTQLRLLGHSSFYGWESYYALLGKALHGPAFGALLFDRSIVEDQLTNAPWDGPFFHGINDKAPFKWAAPQRFRATLDQQENGDPNNKQGNFDGLDYMLLHNLYKIVYRPGLPECSIDLIDGNNNKMYNNDRVIKGNNEDHYKTSIKNEEGVKLVIHEDANVWWTAGEYIEFNEGFETQEGAEFTAEIMGCDPLYPLFSRQGNPEDHEFSESGTQSKGIIGTQGAVSPNNNAAILLIPNPNSGRFTLRVPLETGETAGITIYNMLGEKIVSHIATSSTTELDITGHPKGMYVVNIAARDGKQSVVKMVYQ